VDVGLSTSMLDDKKPDIVHLNGVDSRFVDDHAHTDECPEIAITV
jgi:hypothetical protein